MKKLVYYCDRCGVDTDGYNPLGSLPDTFAIVRFNDNQDSDPTNWSFFPTVDLCETCAEELSKWWGHEDD